LLTDNDKSASTTFGVVTSDTGKPSRVSVLIAPDGSIAKVYDTVAPVEHANQVLADLTSLD
jgi:peroxiredoxin